MIFKFLLLVFVAAAMASLSIEDQWVEFKSAQNKNYETPEEETRRFGIFKENVQKIEEHNKKYDAGEVTYTMGVNKFADLTPDELKTRYTGVLSRPKSDAPTAV